MKRESGNWVHYRKQFNLTPADEVDFHYGERDSSIPYWEAMAEISDVVENCLRKAQAEGRAYLMFIHGWSTSRPGATTVRSMVRGFMRSPQATPFIERRGCIQHETVFVAKIRPLPPSG